MNYYEQKLEEKKKYTHLRPEDKAEVLKKTKMERLKHPKKNAQLGMF
ncbi:MAG: hypothetical protein ACJAV6_000400 [Candidatus Paceibacteria bacterium]|jgi:hypothetical protein